MQASLCSKLQHLPLTDQTEFWKDQIIKNSVPQKKDYIQRCSIFQFFMSVLSKNKPYESIQARLQSILIESINQFYEEVRTLPKIIYVCGHCKDYYSFRSQYLFHCIQLNCPINHYRSSVLFRFKGNNKQVKNQDFENSLKQEKMLLLSTMKINKIHYNITPGFKLQPFKKNPGKRYTCGPCKKFFTNQKIYIIHCIFRCQYGVSQKNSHMITANEFIQPIMMFKKSVENLILNYNLLTINQNSYLRILQKPSTNGNYLYDDYEQFKCGKCQRGFKNSDQLLQHMVFDCSSSTFEQSTHIIQKRNLKIKFIQEDSVDQDQVEQKIEKIYKKPLKIKEQPQIQIIVQNRQQNAARQANIQKQINQQKGKIKIQKQISQQNGKIKLKGQKSKLYRFEINQMYKDYEHFLHDLFWCSTCRNFYEDPDFFVAHSLIFLCPINSDYNSHFYYSLQSERLTVEAANKLFSITQYLDLFQIPQNFEMIQQRYDLINCLTNQIQNQPQKVYKCGNCMKSFNKKPAFMSHSLFKCFSGENFNNSHILKFRKHKVQNDQQKNVLPSALFGLQIMKIKPNKYYILEKKQADQDEQIYCGKCETQFDNPYQFVYHCLAICQKLNFKDNSHLVFEKTSRILTDPLDIVRYAKINQIDPPQQNHTISKQRHQRHQRRLKQTTYSQSEQRDYTMKNSSRKKTKSRQELIHTNQSKKNSRGQRMSQKSYINAQTQRMRKQFDIYENPKFNEQKELSIFNSPKYFCGQCQKSFKHQYFFISHIIQCGYLEHQLSSHHLMSKSRRLDKLLTQRVSFQDPYQEQQQFKQIQNSDKFTCGCGQTFIEQNLSEDSYAKHILQNHKGILPNKSSHILNQIKIDDRVDYTEMKIEDSGNNHFSDEYTCPCKPKIKMSRRRYINHIMKKHKGVSPQSYMEKMMQKNQ